MEDAVRALVCAFADDPILAWWQGERTLRERMFQYLLEDAIRSKDSILLGSFETAMAICAKISRPAGWVATLYRAANSIFVYSSFAPTRALWRLAIVSYALAKMQPAGRFVHIQYLFVNRAARGHGLGARLLSDIVAYANGEKLPLYLETGSSSNAQYFQKRGWSIVAHYDLPCGGPRLYGLQFKRLADPT